MRLDSAKPLVLNNIPERRTNETIGMQHAFVASACHPASPGHEMFTGVGKWAELLVV
jgi:hypothetical protein